MTAAPGTAAGEKTRGKGGRKNTAGKKRKQRERVRALRIAAVALSLVVLLSALLYFVNRRMEKRTYRLAYAETIRQESAAFGLDPYLVAAVIHCESSGRADAHSPKGACGLMQIMPATGAWIAEKLAIPSFTEEMLYEPEQNIRFGCWYLSYLMQKYDGETDLALAAYNAGPGNVKKWLEDPAYSEAGHLKVIPFAETDKYVERVNAACGKYRELYEKELAQ